MIRLLSFVAVCAVAIFALFTAGCDTKAGKGVTSPKAPSDTPAAVGDGPALPVQPPATKK